MEVADRWFEHREVEDGVFLLWEPHVDPMIRGNVWLVRGRAHDLLVDGGLGLGRLGALFGLDTFFALDTFFTFEDLFFPAREADRALSGLSSL